MSSLPVVLQRNSWVLSCCATLLLLWCGGPRLYAQSGTVRGRVVGIDGAALVRATVQLEPGQIGAITDGSGRYELSNVPLGRYMLVVSYVGYEKQRVPFELLSGETRVLDVKMTAKLTPTQVIVTERADRATASSARTSERLSPTVLTVMSAEEIARYPDQTTAETMQRVPGLAITRVRGEAREAIVRGMEPRYNNTLVNGVKMPTPSTNTRVLQMDFLPNDLMERVVVTKSLTPDMEGDAIGGTVDLVMRSAPAGTVARLRTGVGYSAPFLDHDMITFRSDSILDDPIERFGAGYQAKAEDFPRDNMKLQSRSAPPNWLAEGTLGERFLDDRLGGLLGVSVQQTYQYSNVVRNYDAIDPDNNTYLIRRQQRFHLHDKTKIGASAKGDYVFDENNTLDLSLVGFWRINRETRLLDDSNYVFQPVLYHNSRSVVQNYTLFSSVLSGEHRLSNFSLRWRGGWSEARQFKPDRAELTTVQELRNGVAVSVPVFFAVVRDWQHNEDRDLFGTLDLTWDGWKESGVTVKLGGLYRAKTRANAQNEYRLNPVTDSAGNLPPFTNIGDVPWEVLNTGGTPEYGNNNYTCGEDVSAAYAMATWTSGDLSVLGGVRLENTDGHYKTFDVNSIAHLSATKKYSDILPSFHFRYSLTPESNLRLSLGQTIARPNYYDLVPYNSVGEDDREAGNPQLNRTRSTNVDLRYELYPGGGEQVSFGPFFKNIVDPIERTIDIRNPSLPTLSAQNFGTATLYGAEFTLAKSLWDRFIVQATYTFSHSSITSSKITFDRAAGAVLTVDQTRPMQGQSDHVANLAVAFNDTTLGTFAQVSGTYTGRRLFQVSLYLDHDDYLEPFLLLDVSAEQRITSHLTAFLRLTNLLNSAWEVREQSGELIESERYGAGATLGLTWKF